MDKYQNNVIVFGVTLLISLGLASCGMEPDAKQSTKNDLHAPEATVQKSASDHAQAKQSQSVQVAQIEAKPTKPIDLAVDPTMLLDKDNQSDQQQIDITLLPDMFGTDKNKEKKAVSIGLLIDEESENLDKVVDGAEISFELQTN